MELFNNIKNCNKNAAALKKVRARERYERSVIAVLAGSLIGLVIRHFAFKNDEAKLFAERFGNAKDALLGKDKKKTVVNTTATEVPTDFTEVEDACEVTIDGD